MNAVAHLLRAIAAGVLCVFATWIGILIADHWRIKIYNAKHGIVGLGATAGGWSYLLQSPTVAILLSIAFGIGFYWATRLRLVR
jgi:23S rRNA C2498 (ribose-2'-O)-methylase RlmM